MTDSPRAYAKRDDPQTSWDAARSLAPDHLRVVQKAVYDCLKLYGPCHNDWLVFWYHKGGFPEQSDSSIRSRRSELTAKGLCVDTGQRYTLESGRRAVVWQAV